MRLKADFLGKIAFFGHGEREQEQGMEWNGIEWNRLKGTLSSDLVIE
jgi:hypothetical protein